MNTVLSICFCIVQQCLWTRVTFGRQDTDVLAKKSPAYVITGAASADECPANASNKDQEEIALRLRSVSGCLLFDTLAT